VDRMMKALSVLERKVKRSSAARSHRP
jgi:hypothetical protein